MKYTKTNRWMVCRTELYSGTRQIIGWVTAKTKAEATRKAKEQYKDFDYVEQWIDRSQDE